MKINKQFYLSLIAGGLLAGCSTEGESVNAPAEAHYSMQDFSGVKKIDVHVHANKSDPAFALQAQKDGFQLLTINVDYPDFPSIDKQNEIALNLIHDYPKTVYYAATFSMQDWGTEGWANQINQKLDKEKQQGAVAVKVWKNIGMQFRDENNQLVMIDDPGFDPIFDHLAQQHMPLIGHQGEPYNCWLPVEKMSVKNDQEYFSNHPQYHMYLHPEMPSYEQQMGVRDAMLAKNPQLPFMGAHMASLEWSTDKMAEFLDRFPQAVIDMAARMGQLQAQSQKDREKVRQFMIDYQDRILYGTDLTFSPEADDAQFSAEAHRVWLAHWRYLNTDDVLQVSDLDGEFNGLALPKTVIDKIYHQNAQRFFNIH